MGKCLSKKKQRENSSSAHSESPTPLRRCDGTLDVPAALNGDSIPRGDPYNEEESPGRAEFTEASHRVLTRNKAFVVSDWPDPDEIPTVPYKGVRVRVFVYDVYDGDTCSILVPFGDEYLKLKIRVLGVDTPEVKVRGAAKGTELGDLEEQAGAHVREKVKALIEEKECEVRLDKWDKYGGRVNGVVFLESRKYATLTEYLLANYYAKEYHGKKKEDWTAEELGRILAN